MFLFLLRFMKGANSLSFSAAPFPNLILEEQQLSAALTRVRRLFFPSPLDGRSPHFHIN